MEQDCLIVTGSEDECNVFQNNSFGDFLFRQANGHGKRIFQIDGATETSQTYEELCNKARAVAASLQGLGVLSGDTIGISCENRLEYAPVILASVFAGTVLAPVNPNYSPDEIVHVFNISKPRVIFCSAHSFMNISLSLPRLQGISHVVLFDDISSNNSVSVIKYDALLQSIPINKLHQSKDDEIAVILTSSGTTGMPKGVMLSYANLKFFHSFCIDSKLLELKPTHIVLGIVPIYHGYGFGVLLSSIMVGSKHISLPKFEEKLFLSSIEKYKITNLYLAPPLMVFLSKHPLVAKYDLSSVCVIVCGAAPLSREVAADIQVRLPGVDIRQGYGMTESSIAITVTPANSNNAESVGKLGSKLQVKVTDIETGKNLKRGKAGEILVRGPCVMAGYCNDPAATREVIDAEGWLHTGDVGYVDDQGFFYIIDRIKELIKYKGFQVAPAELESILLGMAGVKDAAVVGLPDLTAGELPIAYVVLQPNATLTETSIMDYVNRKVSRQKQLRGVRFTEAIPRNPSGKILRRIIRSAMNSKL